MITMQVTTWITVSSWCVKVRDTQTGTSA